MESYAIGIKRQKPRVDAVIQAGADQMERRICVMESGGGELAMAGLRNASTVNDWLIQRQPGPAVSHCRNNNCLTVMARIESG